MGKRIETSSSAATLNPSVEEGISNSFFSKTSILTSPRNRWDFSPAGRGFTLLRDRYGKPITGGNLISPANRRAAK